MTKDFFRNKINPYFASICESSTQILHLPIKNKPFNPFKFTNYQLKRKKHPGAVDESLRSLVKCYSYVKNPWAYANAIVTKTSGMYYERQHITKHETVLQEFKTFVDNSSKIQELTRNIGNIWL